MTPHLLRTFARRLTDDDPDADLVRRFVAGGDDAAFAALVRRHGATVWAACRHLLANPADAEDAFQATFVALARSATSVRQPAAVGAWLHAAAVRIALNLRRAAARRKVRERAAAIGEAAPSAVPDAAWRAALAAAHEEAARLPEPLRTAFVLCDLEGVSPAAAAARLGWKPGTLTGRLTRARQTLLDRLAARGLAPLAVGVGVLCSPAAAPARLVETTAAYANPAGVVPASVLTLAKGASVVTRTKLLAAAVVLGGGLLIPGGALLRAGGDPPTEADKRAAEVLKEYVQRLAGDDKRLADERARADAARVEVEAAKVAADARLRLAEQAAVAARQAAATAAPAWEFSYYAPAQVTLRVVEDAATGYGAEGWEFAGTVQPVSLTDADRKRITFANPSVAGKTDPPTLLAFKRLTKPKAAARPEADAEHLAARDMAQLRALMAQQAQLDAARRLPIERKMAAPFDGLVRELVRLMAADAGLTFEPAYANLLGNFPQYRSATPADKEAVRAAVADELGKSLSARFGPAPAAKANLTLKAADMPGGYEATQALMGALLAAKYSDRIRISSPTYTVTPDGTLSVTGEEDIIEWLAGMIRQTVPKKHGDFPLSGR